MLFFTCFVNQRAVEKQAETNLKGDFGPPPTCIYLRINILGNKRDLFFLYETLIGGGSLLASFTNSETEKLKDGSTNVARPTSATTIDLQTQIVLEGGMYVSGEFYYATTSALGASLFQF